VQFGVLNKSEHGKPYGITRYWAERDGVRIEFDVLEMRNRDTFPMEFHPLFDYIDSLFIKSYMTDEEYERVVASRTAAEKQRIDEQIRSGGR
jgi:hypothetical protein